MKFNFYFLFRNDKTQPREQQPQRQDKRLEQEIESLEHVR